jgi:hypothetical protein
MLFEKVINRKYKILEAALPDASNANDAQEAQKGQEGSDWTPENADKQDAETDKLKLSMNAMHTKLQNVIAKFIGFIEKEEKAAQMKNPNYSFPSGVTSVLQKVKVAMTNPEPDKGFDEMETTVDSAFSEFEKESTSKTYEQQ